MADKLIIVSRRPGMIRGGRAHPAAAEHALDAFTHAELSDIVGDPDMTAIEGRLLTPAIMAERAAAKTEPKKK